MGLGQGGIKTMCKREPGIIRLSLCVNLLVYPLSKYLFGRTRVLVLDLPPILSGKSKNMLFYKNSRYCKILLYKKGKFCKVETHSLEGRGYFRFRGLN
jgi:hypothetical protein